MLPVAAVARSFSVENILTLFHLAVFPALCMHSFTCCTLLLNALQEARRGPKRCRRPVLPHNCVHVKLRSFDSGRRATDKLYERDGGRHDRRDG